MVKVRATVKSVLGATIRTLSLWGFDLRRTIVAVKGVRRVRRDRRKFRKQQIQSASQDDFPLRRSLPIYGEWSESAGTASGHYFHQDLLVARQIFANNPELHIDVGSSIYGFVSHVASFRNIYVLDIRPITSTVPGIRFLQADLTDLPDNYVEAADSVSCLHALEHFGLGRYGDQIDTNGWRKGLHGLNQLTRDGGLLYLSVPTGKQQRVEFNAQRVFSLPFLKQELEKNFTIQSLSFVDDAGDLHTDVDPCGVEASDSFGATYGCSIWTLRKPLVNGDL